MIGHLFRAAGADRESPDAIDDPARATVRDALAAGARFWLDLADVDDEVLTLLRDDFAFHPLTVEDAEHFGQRPKIETYDGFVLVVAFGLDRDGSPVEVHSFISDGYLVTVHRGPAPGVEALRRRLVQHPQGLPAPAMLLHHVLDGLVDGFFPALADFDDAIDDLQDKILARPTDAQLGTLFDFKRRLIAMRRLATGQRDMVAGVSADRTLLPGMTTETERYFRDLYDHLTRISHTADSYRDLLSAALETHLSTTSNRLNVVMKQLAIVATVFLPMSFLTGFFGQNFGWMADRIGSPTVFWAAGVALQVVVAGGLLVMFRAMGWLGNRSL